MGCLLYKLQVRGCFADLIVYVLVINYLPPLADIAIQMFVRPVTAWLARRVGASRQGVVRVVIGLSNMAAA